MLGRKTIINELVLPIILICLPFVLFGAGKSIFNNIFLPAAVIFIASICIFGLRKTLQVSEEKIKSAVQNLTLTIFNSYILLIPITVSYFDGIWTSFGLPALNPEFWTQIGIVPAIILVMLALDFVSYWTHRMMHHKICWGFHAIHHADEHMNWTTAYRVHWLEVQFFLLTYLIALSWMSIPIEYMAIGAVIRGIHVKYVHLDVTWSHGWFDKVLASPNLHQWHHADVPAAYGKNLADTFPFYDIIFGTYYNPGRCEANLAFEGAPATVAELMIYPFQYWKSIFSRSASSADTSISEA